MQDIEILALNNIECARTSSAAAYKVAINKIKIIKGYKMSYYKDCIKKDIQKFSDKIKIILSDSGVNKDMMKEYKYLYRDSFKFHYAGGVGYSPLYNDLYEKYKHTTHATNLSFLFGIAQKKLLKKYEYNS